MEKITVLEEMERTNCSLFQEAGGEALQITEMINGVSDISWSPDSCWLAYISESTIEENRIEDSNIMYDKSLINATHEWATSHQMELQDPRLITKLPYRSGTSFFDGKYQAFVYLYYPC